MKYAAVIFDLDGTLLDSLEGIALAMNAVLGEQGWAAHPVPAYAGMVGDGIEALVARACSPRQPASEILDGLVADYCRHYDRLWLRHSPPYPGIGELLAFLAKKNMPAAVFSNKRDDFCKTMVSHFFPGNRFADVRGALPGVARKPDPGGVLAIAKKMNVAPETVLYLGDSAVDMKTAVAARVFAGGVTWGFRGRAELRASGAGVIFDHPREVIAFLS